MILKIDYDTLKRKYIHQNDITKFSIFKSLP